jgi:cob(I)alamin adenosyltransferase
MTFRIYTKKGDTGTTQLIGGTRVPKHHQRIEAYGTIDELNSWIGVVRDHLTHTHHRDVLKEVQDRLFTVGSHLATEPGKGKMKLPDLNDSDVSLLEHEMDAMTASLPEMKYFVLPGGHHANSFAHIARCVCRRAERLVTHLNESEPVDSLILIYLNRLSDYLFVLSRQITHDFDAEEIPWKPRI